MGFVLREIGVEAWIAREGEGLAKEACLDIHLVDALDTAVNERNEPL
jgi:hypothetical protein